MKKIILIMLASAMLTCNTKQREGLQAPLFRMFGKLC